MEKYLVKNEEDVKRIISNDFIDSYTNDEFPEEYPAIMVVISYPSNNKKDWWYCEFVYLSDFNR